MQHAFSKQTLLCASGTMIFSQVSLQASSSLVHPSQLHLVVSDIMMRAMSSFEARNITLAVGSMHMEGRARLDTTGGAPVCGAGVGGVEGNDTGCGGGHGGYGGGSDVVNYTSGESPWQPV